MSQPHRKAPPVDPYLRPESITTVPVAFGGVDLPPIQRGVQPGRGFGGEAVDYNVDVIWVNRRQIDLTLRAVERAHPDLGTLMKIVRGYMCHLDSMRSEVGFQFASVSSWLKGGEVNVEKALEQLDGVRDITGSWNDECRLILR